MARKVPLAGESKPLEECSLGDIDAMAGDAAPPSAFNKDLSREASYALVAREMREAGVEMVADASDEQVGKWRGYLELHFASFEQIAKGVVKGGPGGKNPVTEDDELEPQSQDGQDGDGS
jgi:hypothetical protein